MSTYRTTAWLEVDLPMTLTTTSTFNCSMAYRITAIKVIMGIAWHPPLAHRITNVGPQYAVLLLTHRNRVGTWVIGYAANTTYQDYHEAVRQP